jgi:hypothetical protein
MAVLAGTAVATAAAVRLGRLGEADGERCGEGGGEQASHDPSATS